MRTARARRARAAFLVILLLRAALSPSLGAEEIGWVARLVPRVRSQLPGAPLEDVEPNDPIQRGLKVKLEPRASLKVAFYQKGMPPFEKTGSWTGRIAGTATLRGNGEVDFGDPERPDDSTLKVYLGRLWLALLPGADSPEVETPHAVARPRGTYFRVLVDPAVGTVIAVDEGVVIVQAKIGGEPVQVTAGRWVLVPPDGRPTPPALLEPLDLAAGGDVLDGGILEDPPLLDLRDVATEPPRRD
jgi:hypothetical protein